MRVALFILGIILFTGCDLERPKQKYVNSSIGILPYSIYYCLGGMVVNNEGVNLLDLNKDIVSCKGYVFMTPDDYELRMNK